MKFLVWRAYLSQVDKDGTGMIDFPEFLCMMSLKVILVEQKNRRHAVFANLIQSVNTIVYCLWIATYKFRYFISVRVRKRGGWDPWSIPSVWWGEILYQSIFILLLINQKPCSSYCYCSIKCQPVHVHVQDGNGFINRQELAVVMGNLGESLTQEEIQVYLGTHLKLSTPPAFDNNQNWKISHPGRYSGLSGSLKMSTPSTSSTWKPVQISNLQKLWESLTLEDIWVMFEIAS